MRHDYWIFESYLILDLQQGNYRKRIDDLGCLVSASKDCEKLLAFELHGDHFMIEA